jgi:hypothetical protein
MEDAPMRNRARFLASLVMAAAVAGCSGSGAPAAPVGSDAPAATEAAEATSGPGATEDAEDDATPAPAGDLGTATVTVDGTGTEMTIHECGAPSAGWLRVVAGEGDTFVKIVLKPDGGVPEIEGSIAGTAFLTKDETVDWDGGTTGTITSSDYNSPSTIAITFACK